MSLSKPVHLTAGALLFSGNNILAIKRRKEPFKGQWEIVGGHVEEKELPEETAVRELKEEAGMEIEIIDPYIEVPTSYGTELKRAMQPIVISLIDVGDHCHFSFTYAARIKSTEIKGSHEEGSVQWIDPAKEQLSPHLRLAIDIYKRVFGA